MAKIIFNEQLQNPNYYLMKIAYPNTTEPGQFYMLRAWDKEPFLSRPISIYDCDQNSLTFLYRVVGRGTKIFTKLEPGDEITVQGPYGKGFNTKNVKRALLIGGGVGIAPLYMTAKKLKESGAKVDIYFSLRGEEILRKELEEVSDTLVLKTNERVVNLPDYSKYDVIYTCGPEPLMIDVSNKGKIAKVPVYVSMERHMGCGYGVCAGCTVKAKIRNVLVCKDGPVFKSQEVFNLG